MKTIEVGGLVLFLGAVMASPASSQVSGEPSQGRSKAKSPAEVYIEKVEQLKLERARTATPTGREKAGTDEVVSGQPVERREGRYYVEYTPTTTESWRTLHDFALFDNAKRLFPGQLIWTRPLIEGGTVHDLNEFHGRAPVRAVLSGGFAVGGQSSSIQMEYAPTLGEFDKEFALARRRVQAVTPRVVTYSCTSDYHESALLSVGISVKHWFGELGGSMRRASEGAASMQLIRVDQIYYDLVSDTPPNEGWLPPALLDTTAQNAANVLPMLDLYGEVGIIKSVSYGRRTLFIASSTASRKELERVLRIKGGWGGVTGEADLSSRDKEVLSSTNIRAVVIGGRMSPEIEQALADITTGNALTFAENVNRFLKLSAGFDESTGAAPLSCIVEYVYDNQPIKHFDLARLAGTEIQGSSVLAEETIHVSPDFVLDSTSTVLKGRDTNRDIHSDDYTGVAISYRTELAADRRSIDLIVAMGAREHEGDKSYRDKTWFHTEGRLRIYAVPSSDPRLIASFESFAPAGTPDFNLFTGKLHHWFPFQKDVGMLTNLSVHVDGPSGDDTKEQGLKGTARLTVHLERQPR